MSMSSRMVRWLFWPLAVMLVIGTTFLVWRYAQPKGLPQQANATPNTSHKNVDANTEDPSDDPDPPKPTLVSVVHPRRGAMERVTTQPCTVEADEVSVHSQVSGLLKSLGTEKHPIDIGSVVKRGDLLATIDVPEIEKQVERNAAGIELATARVRQMKAKVAIAKADAKAAEAQIVYSEAFARSAAAWLVYRTMKLERMTYLAAKKALEGKLEEEAKEEFEAAKESENAAKAAIVTSKAKKASQDARILLADADVHEAEAEVKVAKAELDRSKVRLDFARITAPFDGIITQRPFFKGAFIRSASEGSAPQSVLTIQRTDVMRVVVQIPDREARYADPGDAAIVEIDSFPEKKFPAKVSRIAKTEDRRTRLMPVEIDLDNADGLIRQGMFGKVTIILDPALKQMSIPSACLVGSPANGNGAVFVHRDGKVSRVAIQIGMDNHKRVEILGGLKETDQVVFRPPAALTEAVEVLAKLVDETKAD